LPVPVSSAGSVSSLSASFGFLIFDGIVSFYIANILAKSINYDKELIIWLFIRSTTVIEAG